MRPAFLLWLLCSGVCGCGARSGLDEPEERPAAECVEPEFGVRTLERCDPERAEDVNTLLAATSVPLAVEVFGCGGVIVLSGRELHVSTDGGASFDTPRMLPDEALTPNLGGPRKQPFAVADDGTLYLLARGGERLVLLRSDDLGESWLDPVDVGVGLDEAWGASLLVRGRDVVAFWLEMGAGPALARSRDGGATFEAPVALGPGINESSRSYPTVCLAGWRGIVASWLDCTTSDCAGEDRTGIAFGRVAVSSGGAFRAVDMFERDNGVFGPIAGCGADGRALVGWSAAPYLGSGGLVVASLDECARARETLTHDGGADGFNTPLSPRFTLGEGGALMRWRLEWNDGSGVATLDARGELVAVQNDPDYDGDGAYDLPIASCALSTGGYALLAQTGRTEAGRDRGQLVVARIGRDASPVEVHIAGPLEDFRAAWLACDRRGRAHVAWSRPDGGGYAAIAHLEVLDP